MRNGTVTIAPVGGAGSFGVAYGVVLGIAKQDGGGVTNAASLATASAALVQRFVGQGSGLAQTGAATTMQVGGRPAQAVVLRGNVSGSRRWDTAGGTGLAGDGGATGRGCQLSGVCCARAGVRDDEACLRRDTGEFPGAVVSHAGSVEERSSAGEMASGSGRGYRSKVTVATNIATALMGPLRRRPEK